MPQRPDPQTVYGELVRERREELGMSQEEVGLAAGTTQGRISEIEAGDNPSFGLSARIARALGWSHVELVRRLEEHELKKGRAGDSSPSNG